MSRRNPANLTASAPVVALAALAILVSSAACKSSRDKGRDRPLETPTGDSLQLTDAGLRLTTDAGLIVVGAGSTLPADFPKAVPLYPMAKVNMAARSNTVHGKSAWSLSLTTGDERTKVVQFYDANMAPGFIKASDLALGDTQMTIWQSAQYDVTQMVAPGEAGETTITMTVSAK